jgi:hypothetical protein
MVCFQTQNPNLGKFWMALNCSLLVYSMIIWNILWPFGIIYDRLVKFVDFCYIFPNLVCNLVCFDQVKSGNPAC